MDRSGKNLDRSGFERAPSPYVKATIAQAFCSQKSFWEITLNYAKSR